MAFPKSSGVPAGASATHRGPADGWRGMTEQVEELEERVPELVWDTYTHRHTGICIYTLAYMQPRVYAHTSMYKHTLALTHTHVTFGDVAFGAKRESTTSFSHTHTHADTHASPHTDTHTG